MKLMGDIRRDFEKVTAENIKLKDRILGYQETISSLRHSLKAAQKSKDKQQADYEEALAQKDAAIKELENCLAHELALKSHDGTNTGTPTSQTPIGKKKAIPNSRRNTGKKKGGRPGHEKHILTPPEAGTVTEAAERTGGDGSACPNCGSENFAPTGEPEIKYEYDIEVKVVRRESLLLLPLSGLRHTVPLCNRTTPKRKMPVWEHGPGSRAVAAGYCKCPG